MFDWYLARKLGESHAKHDNLSDELKFEKRKSASFLLLFEITVKREQSLKAFDPKDQTVFKMFEFAKRIYGSELTSVLDVVDKDINDLGNKF